MTTGCFSAEDSALARVRKPPYMYIMWAMVAEVCFVSCRETFLGKVIVLDITIGRFAYTCRGLACYEATGNLLSSTPRAHIQPGPTLPPTSKPHALKPNRSPM